MTNTPCNGYYSFVFYYPPWQALSRHFNIGSNCLEFVIPDRGKVFDGEKCSNFLRKGRIHFFYNNEV